ncbi:RNA pseudouridylate synthase domain containing protein 2 [Branchiostoma belcheri]|nr:RNA pseudouridylate synthase domain containing protein 2 [Branchiostoma belcheri]
MEKSPDKKESTAKGKRQPSEKAGPSKRAKMDSPKDKSRHNYKHKVFEPTRKTVGFDQVMFNETTSYIENGLRKVQPYFFTFEAFAKGRWLGRTVMDIFSSEFRAHPPEHYKKAIKMGRLLLNGEPVKLDTVLKDNDFMQNTVHRHEPPVVADPVEIVEETDDLVVINKPASMPVHPCGGYRHNSVIFVLGKEHGFENLHPIHRLDRLTSGILIFAKNLETKHRLDAQPYHYQQDMPYSRAVTAKFREGFNGFKESSLSFSTVAKLEECTKADKAGLPWVKGREVKKVYLARVMGEFPDKVECDKPIFAVKHKLGVCRVCPEGKDAKTMFERVSYNGTSSVVRCYPKTGRMHQIRVHLQYLGHPIINDPLYNSAAWGAEKGKGGIEGSSMNKVLENLVTEETERQNKVTEGTERQTKGGESSPSPDNAAQTSTGTSATDQEPSEQNTNLDTQDCLGSKGSKVKGQGATASTGSTCTSTTEQSTDNDAQECEEGSKGKGQGVTAVDPICDECKVSRRDPTPEELVMYLHALSYEGEGWGYKTPPPKWASEDWVQD